VNGLLLTAEKINAAGGILGRPVEIVGLDGKGDAADSVSAYKKLVEEEKVCAVVGTNFSSCNIPIAAVADELKVPVIATAASNELVTVDESGKLHPYSFRLCFIDSYQGTVAGNYAAKQLGLKKAAIITDITDAYSTGVGSYIVKSFEACAPWSRRKKPRMRQRFPRHIPRSQRLSLTCCSCPGSIKTLL
jgi:branched-chain amino acid transport system substrate-binding protein